MTTKKKISELPAVNNRGKTRTKRQLQHSKRKVKYTLARSRDDIVKIDELRQVLKSKYYYRSYNTDSEIYKKLPDLYLNAVEKCDKLQLDINKLTAEIETLEDLRASFRRIFKICKGD